MGLVFVRLPLALVCFASWVGWLVGLVGCCLFGCVLIMGLRDLFAGGVVVFA